MAWSVLRKNVPGKIPTFRSFVVDTTNDIASLPNNVAWGSEAFCIEDGKVYILETTGEWAEKLSGGGSSIEVEAKEITENGIYTADEGKAYSPVTVNVPSQSNTITINGTGRTAVEIPEGVTFSNNVINENGEFIKITGVYIYGGDGSDNDSTSSLNCNVVTNNIYFDTGWQKLSFSISNNTLSLIDWYTEDDEGNTESYFNLYPANLITWTLTIYNNA